MKRFIVLALIWLVMTGQGPVFDPFKAVVGCAHALDAFGKLITEEQPKDDLSTFEQQPRPKEGLAAFESRLSGLTPFERHLKRVKLAHCAKDTPVQISVYQFSLGWDYEEGRGVEKDIRKAVFWYGLAGKNGSHYGQFLSQKFAKHLPPDELDKVRKKIAEWKPDPSKCEELERSKAAQSK